MKKREIKGIIFDLDGTLLNTLEDIADCANETLSRCGEQGHEVEAYRYFVGNGLKVLVERIMPQESPENKIEQGIAAFQSIYEQGWCKKSHPYSGIEVMLRTLKNSGIKLAVLSNKPDAFTQKCVAHFFPDITFGAVAGKKDGVPAKPDPMMALKILDELKVSPSQGLFVGDSSVDMKTGTNAGMRIIGVDWGFRPKPELIAAGAKLIISSPGELIAHVL